MSKKWKKRKSQPKGKKAAARLAAQNDHSKSSSIAPTANDTQTSQLLSDEALKREPTEADVMAIMHDNDLLEYSSSSGSDLRKKSMFEFYKQQWKTLRAAEERSKKADALRNSLNSAAEALVPGIKDQRTRRVNSVVTHLKAGLHWCASNLWLWPAVLVTSPLLYGMGVGAMYGQQPIIAAFLYLLAIGLILAKAITETRTHEKRIGVIGVLLLLGIVWFATSLFWIQHTMPDWLRAVGDKKTTENHPTAPTFPSAMPTPASMSTSTPDLRSELRADGNRAIRLVTMRVTLNRKYSIDELGHFRIMYEVAKTTNRIIPEFYLACQDNYEINTSADSRAKQFGYFWTVRNREPNNTYRPTVKYGKGRQYSAVIGNTQTTDNVEISWDLYNQIPSDQILEDLNGKELYIFVTASLVDKISAVSLQVNNWELFSIKADRLIFPDDKPMAPWFIQLSKEENAIPWKGVYMRNDEPLPPQIMEKFKGQNPGWVWSLDFGLLHPKRLPEPELKVDPMKPS
ncbi:MAG TPA: hypothetical protein VGN90_03260 [Pyrinomonadaceae bacterium]|jgi:hypothetical protein|nr:hypothetical protein [Pyrinomonadaceae bacterium]